MAIQFIPNPNNLSQIDHIDRNRLNNNLSNLRWCDYEMNSRNGTLAINRQGHICVVRITNKGEYYQAGFNINYGETKYKCSYNRNELEEWLIEQQNLYPRNEVYY